MLAIRSRDKRLFVYRSDKLAPFTPAMFRQKAHALNYLKRNGLSEDKWEIVKVRLFEVDENDNPAGPFILSHKNT
jgi:hypothetical protein